MRLNQNGKPERLYPGELNDANIRKIFTGAGDFLARSVVCGAFTLYAYAIDGLTSGSDISDFVIRPISAALHGESMQELYDSALGGAVFNSVADVCADLDTAALKLVNGFCVVLFPGAGAIAFETKTGEKRGPSAPDVENTVKGPKDAFTETVRTNTSLIRRHLRTPDLRLYETKVGRRSLTNVTIAYVHGLTNPALVERTKLRLDAIDIDGFLSPGSVEEYLTGSRSTAFPLLQFTERTDRFCEGLLAGRVGVLVDGLPLGYLLPVDLGSLMRSPEDLGRDYNTASCIRVLRYGALLLGLLLPGFYVAMTVFHPEMIPLPLLRAMLESRETIPFSPTMEVLGLLIAFELLQETGIHLPQTVGNAVSVIGGIVVGSAAVEASFISPAALIVVSLAGVCGFVLPNRDLADALRVWRFALAVLGAAAGVLGVTVGFLLLVTHLSGLESMGVPYLAPYSQGNSDILRPKLSDQKFRSPNFHPLDRRNQK